MLRQEQRSRRSGPLVGFLDVGSSKIACLIAGPDNSSPTSALGARIHGASCMRSRGVKSGVVVDPGEAAQAIRACVSEAERTAGEQLASINIAFSCGRLASSLFAAHAEVVSGMVSQEDVARCLRGGRSYAVRDGRRLVHLNPLGFRLDGEPGGRDPRGMAAQRLTADLHAVTADDAPLRNLAIVIEKCYLQPGGFMIAPFVSAIAATSEVERSLGITVLDIGGGTIKMAVFNDGTLVHVDVLPVGADHLTYDVARALQTPFAEAERIKALYGTLVSAQSDSHESFSYALASGEDGGLHQSNKGVLCEILSRRTEMIAGLIAERIEKAPVAGLAGDKVVLTGGGAEMLGMAGFMANALKRSVRVAKPLEAFGLPSGMSGAAFSTVVGMVAASFSAAGGWSKIENGRMPPQGYLDRVRDWLLTGL